MPNTPSPLSGFAFVGEPLERADALREDADALARLWPGARILVLDQDGSAFTGDDDQPLALTGADIGGGPGSAIFLGLRGEQAWFSVEAASVTVTAPRRLDLRQAALLWSVADATAFSYARGMSYWHSRTRFCGYAVVPWRSPAAASGALRAVFHRALPACRPRGDRGG